MEIANSSQPLDQSSCFRDGFKACHKTSCIVNSAASMADWWAICLVDCLAPGPWSYVYVWALLFHMYRPQIIFWFSPPCFLPCRTDGLHLGTEVHIQVHTGQCALKHTNACSVDRHITQTLRLMTCTRGDTVPADYTIVNTNRNLLYMCRSCCFLL